MVVRTIDLLPSLYERDETAWLDLMAVLAREGRTEDLDLPHLAEYLADMALRDRREVESRMVVLLCHLLKYAHQPDHRSRSWRASVVEQRRELGRLASQGVLRIHAEEVLPKVYLEAIEQAAEETGLSPAVFPAESPYTFAELLSVVLPAEDA